MPWVCYVDSSKPLCMDEEAEFIRSEIPDVQIIVQNECWLEAERRGEPVDLRDPAIQERVADIILGGAGAYLRNKRDGTIGGAAD